MCIAAYRDPAVDPRRQCPICGASLPASADECLESGCRGIRLPNEAETRWFCPDHTVLECENHLKRSG